MPAFFFITCPFIISKAFWFSFYNSIWTFPGLQSWSAGDPQVPKAERWLLGPGLVKPHHPPWTDAICKPYSHSNWLSIIQALSSRLIHCLNGWLQVRSRFFLRLTLDPRVLWWETLKKENKYHLVLFSEVLFLFTETVMQRPIQKTPDMHQTFGIKLVSWNGSDWLHWWWGDKAAEVEAMTWTCITLLLPISSWWPRSWWTRVQNQNTVLCCMGTSSDEGESWFPFIYSGSCNAMQFNSSCSTSCSELNKRKEHG